MAKRKNIPVCVNCGSNETLYITLKNGERLPSYVIKIGKGIWCNPCDKASKGERVSA